MEIYRRRGQGGRAPIPLSWNWSCNFGNWNTFSIYILWCFLTRINVKPSPFLRKSHWPDVHVHFISSLSYIYLISDHAGLFIAEVAELLNMWRRETPISGLWPIDNCVSWLYKIIYICTFFSIMCVVGSKERKGSFCSAMLSKRMWQRKARNKKGKNSIIYSDVLENLID